MRWFLMKPGVRSRTPSKAGVDPMCQASLQRSFYWAGTAEPLVTPVNSGKR